MQKKLQNYNIVWATRSFLDYRIPVFKELDKLIGNNLHLVFSKDYIPNRVYTKIKGALGNRAIGLSGEWKIGPEDRHGMANRNYSVRFNPHLLKTLKKLNPGILIGDGFFKWTLASILFKLKYKTPLIICYERTFHVERNAQWFRTLYRRWVIKLTDAMCCSGKECGRYAQSLGMTPSRITYGHMVADTKGLAREASKISSESILKFRKRNYIEGIVFLYVGSLSERKGVKHLLEAWNSFTKQYPRSSTLMLVGNGELAERLKRFCTHTNLNNIRFAGNIDYDGIANYYAVADVFVMPTLEDNWSLVVPEAMACGLPVLCSTYNGCCPEMIKNGGNGWIFDPLNKNDIIKVLKWCLENKDRLAQMGKRSKEIVKPFNPENAAHSIVDACELAIKNR